MFDLSDLSKKNEKTEIVYYLKKQHELKSMFRKFVVVETLL